VAAEVPDLWVPVKDQAAADAAGKEACDARAPKYVAQYGPRCWEIDALAAEPDRFIARVKADIEAERNADLWNEAVRTEGETDAKLKTQETRLRKVLL
jgi:hypothetical protein